MASRYFFSTLTRISDLETGNFDVRELPQDNGDIGDDGVGEGGAPAPSKDKMELTNSPASASFTEDLGNGVTLEMIHVPSGIFWMGAPEDEKGRWSLEFPQHRVSVPSFFMGKYPVTQRQWLAVSLLGDVDRELTPDPSYFKGDSRPVDSVSWDEAVEFCARLSKKAEKDYRLPSEAEWEYACRARTTTSYHFGEKISTELANSSGAYQGTTQVGRFGANGFGLYDMHGNVWEWCLDLWHENYKGAPIDGSAWLTSGEDEFRALRGGSWYYGPVGCRAACRARDACGNRSDVIGFRVVCASSRTL